MRAWTFSAAAAALLAVGTAPALAGWQDQATPSDVARLNQLDNSRHEGLAALAAGTVQGDSAGAEAVVQSAGDEVSTDALVGGWRCRTIRLGGVQSIVYRWFNCRVSERGGHLYFEKLSGTQLINGWLYPDNGRFVLLGAWSVVGEPRHAYSGNAAGYGASATPDDAIGLVSSLGPGHVKIEFPAPVQESVFDVMELRR